MTRTLTQRGLGDRRERVVVYLGTSTVEKLKLLAKERDDNLSGVVRFIVAEWFHHRAPASLLFPGAAFINDFLTKSRPLLDAGRALLLDAEIGREAHGPEQQQGM